MTSSRSAKTSSINFSILPCCTAMRQFAILPSERKNNLGRASRRATGAALRQLFFLQQNFKLAICASSAPIAFEPSQISSIIAMLRCTIWPVLATDFTPCEPFSASDPYSNSIKNVLLKHFSIRFLRRHRYGQACASADLPAHGSLL